MQQNDRFSIPFNEKQEFEIEIVLRDKNMRIFIRTSQNEEHDTR